MKFSSSVNRLSEKIYSQQAVYTPYTLLQNKIAKQDKAIKKRKAVARKFGNRLAARTKRVAAANIAALPGEAIPFLGAGILLAGTAYEL